MMVITAMATGLVLSTAYVAARTNGTVIGANLAASSEARVEAESSLALTVAALTSSHDWRTLHQNGLLFEHAEEGREIRVDLIDMATGAAPDESTVDVKACISCRVDGIERTAEAEFFIALPEQARSIDVDLGEFAMFAGDSITVRSEAVVEPWSASPAHNRGDPIRVATSLGSSSGVRVEGSGTIVRGVEYAAGSRSIDSGPLPLSRIPDGVSIPMPSPPHDLAHADYIENPTGRLDVDTRVGALTLDSGQTIELAGGADLLVEGDLNLSGGATLRVSGDSQVPFGCGFCCWCSAMAAAASRRCLACTPTGSPMDAKPDF